MSRSTHSSELFRGAVMLLPEPQKATLTGGAFTVGRGASIALAARGTAADRFAAQVLTEEGKERFGVALAVGGAKSPAITLKRNSRLGLPDQGYTLAVTPKGVEVVGKDEAGLYYGVQTLLQLLRRSPVGGVEVPCVCGLSTTTPSTTRTGLGTSAGSSAPWPTTR